MTLAQIVARLAGLVAVVAVVAVTAATIGLPSAAQLRATFAGMGWWAGAGFAVLYAAVALSPLPKTVFTLAAGALFGVAEGLPAVLAGATAGAVAAFYLSRVLGRDAVRRLTGVRLNRFDDLLARSGLTAVLVARLVPVVPFTAVNYVAGLTAVRLRDFLLGTVVGIVPATTAYVTIGAYGGRPGSWPVWAAVATLMGLTAVGAAAGWRRRHTTASAADASRQPGPED